MIRDHLFDFARFNDALLGPIERPIRRTPAAPRRTAEQEEVDRLLDLVNPKAKPLARKDAVGAKPSTTVKRWARQSPWFPHKLGQPYGVPVGTKLLSRYRSGSEYTVFTNRADVGYTHSCDWFATYCDADGWHPAPKGQDMSFLRQCDEVWNYVDGTILKYRIAL